MLYRKKQETTTETRKLRHTIKLDNDVYMALDQWKSWIRIHDHANRLTVSDIVRHGLELAMAELEAKYGHLRHPTAKGDDSSK